MRGKIGEEFFDLRGGHASGADAIGGAADGSDDVIYEGLRGGIGRGLGRDDAVTIERAGGEDFSGVGGFGDGEGIGGFLAEVGKDLFGGGEKYFAVRGGVVDRIKGQRIFAAQ